MAAARSSSRLVTGAALLVACLAGLAFAVQARSARAGRLGPCQVRGLLPDPACTPGAVDTTSTSLVCGTTTAGRRHVDAAARRRVFLAYGFDDRQARAFDVDHLVPLELGGSNDLANLWPEAVSAARAKDRVEDALHDRVCRGELALDAAQRAIARDWTAVR